LWNLLQEEIIPLCVGYGRDVFEVVVGVAGEVLVVVTLDDETPTQ
jgi:hypothetical protein